MEHRHQGSRKEYAKNIAKQPGHGPMAAKESMDKFETVRGNTIEQTMEATKRRRRHPQSPQSFLIFLASLTVAWLSYLHCVL